MWRGVSLVLGSRREEEAVAFSPGLWWLVWGSFNAQEQKEA